MSRSRNVVSVIGSLNIDFVTRTSRLPAAGETLAAQTFDTGFGGKGANQAVAAARLAGDDVKVQMIGSVGDDSFGGDYLKALQREGIDASSVRQLKGEKTGVTNIIVEEATGENRILFVENANGKYSKQYDSGWDLVSDNTGEVLVLQLELPLPVVLHNMRRARELGKHVVFNPAPALRLPDSAYRDIDTLIMNETESEILSDSAQQGGSAGKEPVAALTDLAKEFLGRGVQDAVIITLGENGLVYATASGTTGHLSAFPAKVVDTTAAGDTFVGGYAVQRIRSLSSNFDYSQALSFASRAASRTVEKEGAMAAIPRLDEL